MLMGLAAAVAVVLALCLRGSLTALAGVHLRAVWLMVAALAAQVLVVNVLVDLPETTARAAHVGTYVAAGVFLALNLRVAGVPLVAAGAAANGITIALNGGVLPASPRALERAGWSPDERFANSTPVDGARLAFLGDNHVTPDWVPFSNVYSLGDVAIVLGVFVLAYRASRRPTATDRSPAASPDAATAGVRTDPAPGPSPDGSGLDLESNTCSTEHHAVGRSTDR